MSTPTNGSWDGNQGTPEGSGAPQQPAPQYGQQYGQPTQQSIGQGYDQAGQQSPSQGYGQPEQPGPYSAAPQASAPQQGGFGHQGGQYAQGAAGSAGQAVAGAGDGMGDLFSDFAFKKSLTEKIASMAFLITVVWAVIRFVETVAHAWGKQDFGGTKVSNMGGFEATMTTLAALVGLVLVVAVARLLLELFINVARIATRNRD